MFERYTEKARRVIFFARYEASQFGSPYIETAHLLLGLIREDRALTNRFLRSHASIESIRQQIEQHTTVREKVSTSVDLPLSNECKRVLAYAAEEAERLSHKHIGTEHLLLGLLREEKCSAAEILTGRGLQLAAVRGDLARNPHVTEGPASRAGGGEQAAGAVPTVQVTPSQPVYVSASIALDSVLEPFVSKEQNFDTLTGILIQALDDLIESFRHRAKNAIENHEFEKARFYSEQESVRREELRLLLQRRGSRSSPETNT